ncbi:MAG: saccharopine dehydrogenase family protein [Thermodesulfobacteriota bacterium]
MARVLIIGAGGVGRVTTHKCARAADIFSDIMLASRNRDKCDGIAAELSRPIQTARVDADNVAELCQLIRSFRPDVVIHVALPYQDLTIMEACLETGVHYIDTANYEDPKALTFRYKEQWEFNERFAAAGITGLLGCGFDPGVTNAYIAYGLKKYFDEIRFVDIMDCNAGDHGKPFATNFNPELNIREITLPGRFWENGSWKEIPAMSVHKPFDFPEIGEREMYLLYHEEMESLVRHIPGLVRIRFWMTFSEKYLTHLRVLENVGLTSIEPVMFQGRPVIPLEFLKALLPDPASLAANYKGKTNIGCMMHGVKDGKERSYFIYNVCDHEACYRETRSQAVSYTAGVPPAVGAMMLATGAWNKRGVVNVEELDPEPFLMKLAQVGLPFTEVFPDQTAS